MGWRSLTRLAVVALLATACATPVGVIQGDTQTVHRELTANALSAGRPSEWSAQVLRRNSLFERFEEEPAAALAELHAGLQRRVTVDRLFALAELSFLHAEQSSQREYYLAAAAYAYAFILPEKETSPIRPVDPRARLAVDLYNLGVSRGLRGPDGESVVLEAGSHTLPFGELTLTVNDKDFFWAGYRFSRLVSVGELVVRGLSNRYRQAGVGAPLAAEVEPADAGPNAEAARRRIPPGMKVPLTAFMRFAAPLESLLSGRMQARLELYVYDQSASVKIGDRDTPLELEPTAALAYQLEGARIWDMEIAGFRFADQPILADGLLMLHPYRAGRIPVVLVHGTASSPARWAELYNELHNDPALHGRYQYWLFQYSTGQPVLYSAMLLRRALRAVVAEIDPEDKDPALRRMVVIGHSQGGLLTKLLTIDSGEHFWRNLSREPFESIRVSDETRSLLREALFFEPVPSIERVIFMSTPHRGSYHASGWVLDIIRRLVTMPGRLANQLQNLATDPRLAYLARSRLPNSIDNMSPGNPFLVALNACPIDPRIKAHSIIAVKNPGPPDNQNDGVVAYQSAHIDGVQSEAVVVSGHSVQGTQSGINEVRRILRLHVGLR